LDAKIKDRISKYLHAISVLPRSGEDAFDTILQFGAWARLPLKPRLEAGLKVETAFVYGQIDWMDPEAARQLIRAKHKHVRSVSIVPDGGHHMYLENPEAFNKVLLDEVREALGSWKSTADDDE
jgi:cardiolipin-specific phospholipase